jgi:tetratricopeptide (TPR) repeat protein
VAEAASLAAVEGLPELRRLTRSDERLRDVAADPPAVEAALAAGRKRLAAGGDRSRLLGYVGIALRLLGRHGEAIATQRASLDAAADSRSALVARIRLGEALRCADRLDEAERELRAALDEAEGQPLLRDFALQHLGKTLVDAGRADDALPLLAEALVLREAKGDGELVASTRAALERARRL